MKFVYSIMLILDVSIALAPGIILAIISAFVKFFSGYDLGRTRLVQSFIYPIEYLDKKINKTKDEEW